MKKLLLILVLFIAGCGTTIQDGEVSDKSFIPAHNTEETDQIIISVDPYVTMPVNRTVYHPDRWTVTFKKYDESSRKYIYRTINVSREKYESFQINDYISVK